MDTEKLAKVIAQFLREQPFVEVSECRTHCGDEYLRVYLGDEDRFIVTITEAR